MLAFIAHMWSVMFALGFFFAMVPVMSGIRSTTACGIGSIGLICAAMSLLILINNILGPGIG